MGTILIYTILSLCIIGAAAAIILYVVSQKFKVYEDPRIDDVEKMLPGANCGGCGYPGCRGFADNLVKSDAMDGFFCPVGGADVMSNVATYLGRVAEVKDPMVAVVRCNGSCDNRPKSSVYNGEQRCIVSSLLFSGDTDCSFGCLGMGDCVAVCNFGAIYINKNTMLAEVDIQKCTACGACVTACPKGVIELRKRGVKDRGVYVSCVNKDKGAAAKKACSAACIACKKCFNVCPFDAITVENNLAFIDSKKCKLCRKCVAECPTGAIWAVNFPEPKQEAPAKADPAV